ncbi:MAG: SDR family NAD(P)-dependent oxidoreductase [Acidimicrobiia bacterium]|nr:SDR family NAD(P)-dependent oxidoreductase [Acidimicrobiia bacterium]
MVEKVERAVAVVGVGAVLPDAPNADAYWENLKAGRYSISDVTADRWDPALYFDPDPKAPDKTYSMIGGWVREVDFSPLQWRLPIPPKVSDAMDRTQKWSITASREALLDYGYPDRPLDPDRTAVVLGNAMAGDMHYLTSLRAYFPEYAEELRGAPSFAALPGDVRTAILDEMLSGVRNRFPNITEDTMPGELGNIIAGRVANLFDFHGPNFVVDAACASALAAIDAAIEGLENGDYDAVLTGGIDANMGVPSFIKFCKIGALSATGTRPYHDGADGFVMGEGAAVFLLKRLADAEKDGDHVYAVIRGLGGSSDGKGKGITAPNPKGQQFAVARGWRNANLVPNSATYIEGHGTSTRVGDVVETESISRVFADLELRPGSVPLGSVKSNIGHLKSAAGAAGMLKAIKSLDDKLLAPSLGGTDPNPNIDFSRSPLFINKELREWKAEPGQVRTAGVSAFGFGGTNFHVVLEEYIPGRLQVDDRSSTHVINAPPPKQQVSGDDLKAPVRGALVVGAATMTDVRSRLESVHEQAAGGAAPDPAPPMEDDLRAAVRIAIDYGNAAELATKTEKAIKAIDADNPGMWKALRNQGIFLGTGDPGMVAFLYTGQGSQYANMLNTLRETEPIVSDMFDEADRIMEPVLGKPLSDYIFADPNDGSAMAAAEMELMQTEITQPAVLTVDAALTEMLGAYGVHPDMVMGHSLGEYGALVAAGALPFEDALEAVAGRGREMANVQVEDNGLMAAVFAPLDDVVRITESVEDYVVVANYNSTQQAVIGGSTPGVTEASRLLTEAGAQVIPLPVSHAFHTEIVAPAAEPLKNLLGRLRLESPAIPLVANIDGEFYPMGPNVVPKMIDILGKQIASPVRFVTGLRTLHDAGCKVFVEVGPKKALQGLADDVLGDDPDVVTLFTNHPKQGDLVTFNQALCGLYAAGLGVGQQPAAAPAPRREAARPVREHRPAEASMTTTAHVAATAPQGDGDMYTELGHLFADFLAKGAAIYAQGGTAPAQTPAGSGLAPVDGERPVVVTGAGLGLPGGDRVFGDDKVPGLLHGEQFIDTIPLGERQKITDKHITRLVKSEAGGGHFETIDDQADVIKLAGRGGRIDLTEEFGFPEERIDSLDQASVLAIGAGLDALRDAGIPLVMKYKDTTTGTQLPERWMLPEAYRATTGVVFASAFPGANGLMEEAERFYTAKALEDRLTELQSLQARISDLGATPLLAEELQRRIHQLEAELEQNGYTFNRKFLYRAVSFGHAQFAEYIGATGPNTQINAACASTTQGVALAEDWIRTGRCERVVVISGDDVTSDELLQWIGSGFLAMGAAATDEAVEDAALPFDRRRHGMILGMGAAAIVVESPESVSSRGLQPIAEVLSANTANSAFHGSRLDPSHIRHVMEDLVATAERRWGVDRHQIAPNTVFVSHETYTPARGGSAQAEIDALRFVFGQSADRIVITNTKGYTGHAMGAGVEDILAIKSMETGMVPAVPNHREPDPDLGDLNLSRGGTYPITYALRLGAGFGSQISMTLYRHVPLASGVHPEPDALGFETRVIDSNQWNLWLRAVTGLPGAETEIVKRTLRVRDVGAPIAAPSAPPAPSTEYRALSTPVVASSAPVVTPPEPVAAAPTPAASPQAPAPTAAPAPVVAPPAEPAGDPVADRVLELVSAQTGYPPDMLDLDLDLEADLGVDTVKQAETFAAIREEYDIERDDSLALRDYPTLADVIGFVRERRPDLAAAAPPPATSPQAPAPSEAPTATAGDPVAAKVLELVSAQTGYPPDMLDLDLDLEADLGVDTVKQAETFAAIREEYDIERDDSLALRDYPTLADVIGFVRERRPDLAAASPETRAPSPESTPLEARDSQLEAAPGQDPVVAKVLELVAEQTGYPTDMLELDADLEADLGVDTVKQAETFAAIREEYDIERDDSLALRDYPTLADVIGFVRERRPDLAAAAPPPSSQSPAAAAPTAPSADLGSAQTASTEDTTLRGDDEAAAGVARRIPTPVLRPALDHCVPTGVTLDESSRIVVMLDEGGVGKALLKRLDKIGAATLAIDDAPSADELKARLDEFAEGGDITGVYWLPGLDTEPAIAELDLDGWREHLRRRVKLLFETMRHAYDQVGAEGTFLLSATRLGGLHGYGPDGATAPMGGAVTGFTKAFKREKPDALVKAVDFPASRKTAALADALIDETLSDPGAVEIGRKDGHRWTIGITEQPLPEEPAGITLDSDSVIVVTGAAGSIVSAITADLARASSGTFHLLDLTPEPDRNDSDIAAFGEDRDGLKRTIFERLKASGEKATPAIVERHLAGIERSHAALATIQAIEAAGGTAVYHSVDLTDGGAVGAAMQRVADDHGKVDVLLHAGGLEISRLLPDKERREYDLVFDVKADGWFNLLRGLGDTPIASTVVFSSVAGRFGNNGQTDYSAANDLLCKYTANQRNTGSDTLGVALDWTAWGDIGMATRGSIPTVMKAVGIDMLPAAAGIPIVRREVTGRSTGGEMVVGLRLGILLDEFHPTGGVAPESLADETTRSVMTDSVASFGIFDGLSVSVDLDPTEQPFLFDHQIDGTPVLPGVMGVEAFAAAARIAFPDRAVLAVEDVDFQAPFKFYRNEPRTVTVHVTYTLDGDDVIGHCRLIGVRTLANQEEPQVTIHFTGNVRLAVDEPVLEGGKVPAVADTTVDADAIYTIYFHGPAYQVMDQGWIGDDSVAAAMKLDLPSNHIPPDASLVTQPRLTELAFQTAGVWEIGTTGRMALPMHIDRVSYASGEAVSGRLHAVVTPVDEGFDAKVVDEAGTAFMAMRGYRTVVMPAPVDEEEAAPLRAAMSRED